MFSITLQPTIQHIYHNINLIKHLVNLLSYAASPLEEDSHLLISIFLLRERGTPLWWPRDFLEVSDVRLPTGSQLMYCSLS